MVGQPEHESAAVSNKKVLKLQKIQKKSAK